MIVWVIGRNYPFLENGNQGLFELEQAKMISRHGNDVHYLACCLHPTKRINGKKGIQSWNDEQVKVSVLSDFFAPRVYPFYFARKRNNYWEKLFDYVEKRYGTPDVIHIHYPAMLMIAEALKEYYSRNTKIVATEHWSKVLNEKLDPFEINKLRHCSRYINSFICVSNDLAHSLRTIIGDSSDIYIIPNFVSELFKPKDNNENPYEFISVGRLVKMKQFDQIINAFSDCFPNRDIKLTIVGDGPERNNLQELINRRNMNERIMLTGILPREEVACRVASANCLVSYSKYETFGVPIVEAWSCGIPVIMTDTTAVSEYALNDYLGIRVSCERPKELRQAMRSIYEKRNKYDKKSISTYAMNNYSEQAVYQKLKVLYKST